MKRTVNLGPNKDGYRVYSRIENIAKIESHQEHLSLVTFTNGKTIIINLPAEEVLYKYNEAMKP